MSFNCLGKKNKTKRNRQTNNKTPRKGLDDGYNPKNFTNIRKVPLDFINNPLPVGFSYNLFNLSPCGWGKDDREKKHWRFQTFYRINLKVHANHQNHSNFYSSDIP